MSKAWAHLHLPRLLAHRAGRGDENVISVKVPGHKVRYHAALWLRDVKFQVNEKGRQRTLKDGVRNVHAWVVGEVEDREDDWSLVLDQEWRRVVYSPYKGATFVDYETKEPVLEAREAVLVVDQVYYR